MFKIKCMCGDSEKMFKFNIGTTFKGICCERKGYEDDGTCSSTDSEEVASLNGIPVNAMIVDEVSEEVVETQPLKKMSVKELKSLAIDLDIHVEGKNKKSLINLIEESRKGE